MVTNTRLVVQDICRLPVWKLNVGDVVGARIVPGGAEDCRCAGIKADHHQGLQMLQSLPEMARQNGDEAWVSISSEQ